MKYNREALNKEIAALRNQYELPEGNLPALNEYIRIEYQKFLAFIDKPRTEKEIKDALGTVETAVELYNDESRNQRIEALEEMSFKDAFAEYLRNQLVPGFKVVYKKEEVNGKPLGYCVDTDEAVYLQAYDVLSTLCAIEWNGILDMVCIWADNMAHVKYRNDAKFISMRSMHPSYIEMRKRNGWDISYDENSWNKLKNHLNAVVSKISCGTAPELNMTDMFYVIDGIVSAKDEGNKAGELQIRNEKTIIKYIFRSVFTRANDMTYAVTSQTRAGSEKAAPRTVEANKEAGENAKLPEFSPVSIPKATTATVGKTPAKKPAKKAAK